MVTRFTSYGLTGTAAAFLWATAVLFALAAVGLVVYWFGWHAFIEGEDTLSDVRTIEDPVAATVGLAWAATLLTAVLFSIWFFHAYRSAASRGATGRTWGPGWTLGAWFIPVAHLVIPKLVMNEVDRMSNPRLQAPLERRWRGARRHPVNDLWWTCLVMAVIVQGIATWFLGEFAITRNGYGSGILIAVVAAVLHSAAAALAGALVFVIGRRLRER